MNLLYPQLLLNQIILQIFYLFFKHRFNPKQSTLHLIFLLLKLVYLILLDSIKSFHVFLFLLITFLQLYALSFNAVTQFFLLVKEFLQCFKANLLYFRLQIHDFADHLILLQIIWFDFALVSTAIVKFLHFPTNNGAFLEQIERFGLNKFAHLLVVLFYQFANLPQDVLLAFSTVLAILQFLLNIAEEFVLSGEEGLLKDGDKILLILDLDDGRGYFETVLDILETVVGKNGLVLREVGHFEFPPFHLAVLSHVLHIYFLHPPQPLDQLFLLRFELPQDRDQPLVEIHQALYLAEVCSEFINILIVRRHYIAYLLDNQQVHLLHPPRLNARAQPQRHLRLEYGFGVVGYFPTLLSVHFYYYYC